MRGMLESLLLRTSVMGHQECLLVIFRADMWGGQSDQSSLATFSQRKHFDLEMWGSISSTNVSLVFSSQIWVGVGSFSDLAESPDICHKTFALACVQSASTPVHVAHLDLEAC